ncbi:biopolymer transporter ExbD [Marinomonas piezotolerans]|uniref:Biopolymer transporter ExbD n=1 Tax=Marinomonas piezotolerans TaxID=2213058 RepID=A0A370UC89_9GAMM|nr:biopolymer transporter ExbD [Marinomonas piezotolerans]RDL45410.1 biopolymer transporter ExbD [Marinomonas piezotolerans]
MPLKLEQPRRRQLISLTPLIDVVFILLLFFMLSSSFVAWRTVDTPLAAPSSTPVEASSEQPHAVFELRSNDGFVWFEDQRISLENSRRIRELVSQHLDDLFVLKAHDDVELQTLMRLADQLKLQGADTISIANAFRESKP